MFALHCEDFWVEILVLVQKLFFVVNFKTLASLLRDVELILHFVEVKHELVK